ncbi:C40 family peptidase, partial [Vagococcus teuberi]
EGTTQSTPEQSTPEQSTPTPAPSTPVATTPTPAPTPSAPAANGSAIVSEAYKHIGKPYVWGAKGPDSFDCSGFTSYVFRQAAGKEIGGWTVPQESAGTQISLSELQPGDLVFWGSRGATYHVGIYVGGGQYIHAPQPGESVKVTSMSYYSPDFGVRVN